jgi:hypothetical protein
MADPHKLQQGGVPGYDIASPRADGTIDELVVVRIIFDPTETSCSLGVNRV